MTAELRYPGAALLFGVDGRVPSTVLAEDCDGCLDIPCADDVAYLCSFVDLLPCGPLWDTQKEAVRNQIAEAGGIPECGFECPSMPVLAAFIGQNLSTNVRSILGANLRESNPLTAVETVDDWLDRLGWSDCFRTACTADEIDAASPYTASDGCGGVTYVATDFPADFEAALKHAILRSVVRFGRGVIKNLDAINYVIEPLGVTFAPAYSARVQCYIDDPDAACPCGANAPCWANEIRFKLTPTGTTIPGAPTADSFCGECADPVAIEQTYSNGVDTVQLYPNVIAAECFVRALLPRTCPNIIERCDRPVTAVVAPVGGSVVANDDSAGFGFFTFGELATATSFPLAIFDADSNDTDPEGDAFSIVSISSTAGGTANTPDGGGWFGPIAADGSDIDVRLNVSGQIEIQDPRGSLLGLLIATATLQYTIQDATGATDTATITLNLDAIDVD